jgi:hypothetical protein
VTLRAKLATTQPAGIEVCDQETRKEFPGIFSAKQGAKLRHPWDGANSNVQLYVPLQKKKARFPTEYFWATILQTLSQSVEEFVAC